MAGFEIGKVCGCALSVGQGFFVGKIAFFHAACYTDFKEW